MGKEGWLATEKVLDLGWESEPRRAGWSEAAKDSSMEVKWEGRLDNLKGLARARNCSSH